MSEDQPQPEFSHVVRIADLSEGSGDLTLEANQFEREALARRFNLISLDGLVTNIHIETAGRHVIVSGKLDADVVQRCVTTLAPVPGSVVGSFNVRFIPAGEFPDGDDVAAIDVESDEDIEMMTGDAVDVGEVAAQSLSLVLDPYPHAEGVGPEDASSLQNRAESGNQDRPNPFAVLKKLYEKG